MTNCIESHELSAWRISWNLELVGARGWSRIRIQKKRVTIARRRLEISQVLMDKGQADEAKVESVREQVFRDQASLFKNQETYITRQGNLRQLMGYVE